VTPARLSTSANADGIIVFNNMFVNILKFINGINQYVYVVIEESV
jgi:hypothetical protein